MPESPDAGASLSKPKSDLALRLVSAAVGVPIILWLLYGAPTWGFLCVVVAATAVASVELMSMVMSGSRTLVAWGVIASLAIQASLLFAPGTGLPDSRVLLTVVMSLVLVGLLISLVHPEPIERAAQRAAWLLAGPLYVGGLLATLIMLHRLPNGGSWVVLSMMLAWFGDTGAYFVGRAFGRRKLYPTVSPKKTVEGAFGGLAGSTAGALLAHFWYLQALPLGAAIALGLVGGALGQAGDLCESLIKRSVGVKDSGRLIPGHGGVLDRIDALMFTSAVTCLYTLWS